MKIKKINRLLSNPHGVIVIPLFRGLSRAAIGVEFPELQKLLQQKKILGRDGEALFCNSLSSRRLFLLIAAGGTDRKTDARKLACLIMSRLREKHIRRVQLYLSNDTHISPGFLLNLIDYLHLNNYRFDRYLRKKSKPVQRLDLVRRGKSPWPAAALNAAETTDRCVVFCRDLVNEIPSRITPDTMVQTASDLAAEHHLVIQVFRKSGLVENGLNGLLAVGAAAACSPALISLEYVPEKFSHSVSLVGKGITFDAGGLNLKPGNSMEEMKCDMAGAAVVLAVMKNVAWLRLPVKVTAWAALAENMPGSQAYKPGDIITYANKKTVEIVNTDAEGRLILADALIMASRQRPDAIIEFSTLTGAVVTALGDGIAGLMCRNKKLRTALLQAADACGELLWELPLFSEYRKDITAKIADLKNANYHGASSIKAGLFLQEFVGKTPFAHIDIAGTAFLSRPGPWLGVEGATGFGVRLMTEYLKNLA
ncbi:MAG: leucyl aminopeptidase family protein [Candidatus Aminicenantes bacterium]|nr:leucyl aminopeptidase family protein [Candidatus Aminicenantes bacterium]